MSMNQLQVFNHPQFGEVEILIIEGREHFPATDMAEKLGYSNTSDAINRHCKKDGVVFHEVIDSLGRKQRKKFITEGNLYRLITNSKLPEAEILESWVFDEVLPTIRKTGGYVANDDLFINTYLPHADEQTKLLFRSTLLTVREQNEKIAVLTPMANKYSAYLDADGYMGMGDVAKILSANFKGLGRNLLFEFLRDLEVLKVDNIPYQRYMTQSRFKVVPKVVNGVTNEVTLVSPKGFDFIEKLVKEKYINWKQWRDKKRAATRAAKQKITM